MKSKYLIIILFLVILSSCDTVDNKLQIYNTSSDTIFYFLKDQRMIGNDIEPMYYRLPKSNYIYENCLFPNQKKNCPLINDIWEERIKRIPDGKIKILIFKKTLLDTTKWERIVTGQLCSKIIERDVEDLKILNWTIIYDGK